jgi:hypothetical protein
MIEHEPLLPQGLIEYTPAANIPYAKPKRQKRVFLDQRRRKLKASDARAIRAEYKRFSYNRSNRAELALKYKVSRAMIQAIVLNARWKDA